MTTGTSKGGNLFPHEEKGRTQTLEPSFEGIADNRTLSQRQMLGLTGGALMGAALLGSKPAQADVFVNQLLNPGQFITPHYLFVATGQEPNTNYTQGLIVLSGVALMNEKALRSEARIFSAYQTPQGGRVWIITEATDGQGARRSTCILLLKDY